MSDTVAISKRAAERHGGPLLKDEQMRPAYAWDMAPCKCKPTHEYMGVPCTPVAEPKKQSKGCPRYRCTRCNARWTVRHGKVTR